MLKNDGSKPIQVKYGNSGIFLITLSNSAGSAIDLTGATILFTVKKSNEIEQVTDDDNTALITKTITDITPLEGKFTLSISPDDTKTIGFGDFVYDFKVTRSAESSYTTPISTFSVVNVVTQR